MRLNRSILADEAFAEKAGLRFPRFDVEDMRIATLEAPGWVHFGAGNIFRGFIARLQQRLLEQGLEKRGILAVETFDYDIISKIYDPFDNLTLLVSLNADGSTKREVIASVADALRADSGNATEMAKLRDVFRAPSLQMATFTITEKGYALWDMRGELLPLAAADIAAGPEKARHAMALAASLMLDRYRAGAAPLALLSLDNCSRNGWILRQSVLAFVNAWFRKGFVEQGFVDYMNDEKLVSFPWSMIDKITPRPAETVCAGLAADGMEGLDAIVTNRGTYIAPFVNAEAAEYLVVEDTFPNGRPPLEQAGVYMTDRSTVNDTERMKVTTCLNPLHTALALYGCLLGYSKIADEMTDADLRALAERIGYDEGMPVVVDPKIISPQAFLREVLEERLPNPFLPDAPQRIATDTSQKLPIRFGETIKSYLGRPDLSVKDLVYIPLALAGWLRYLLAVDDNGDAMKLSPDPVMQELRIQLSGVCFGKPESCAGKLAPILSNAALFGTDLVDAGLADKIESMLREMLEGPGAVRRTLHRYVRLGQEGR